tara:strand:+ start:411 stop:605 length:195 start_codon:yes stop_codon:yes gene_type:complete
MDRKQMLYCYHKATGDRMPTTIAIGEAVEVIYDHATDQQVSQWCNDSQKLTLEQVTRLQEGQPA